MDFTRYPLFLPLAIAGLGASLALAPGEALAPQQDAPVLACLPPAEPRAESAPAPRAESAPAAVPAVLELEPERDPVRQALVEHLSRRFFIAPGPTERIVETAYRAARQAELDPLLVLAVISVESRFNPIAESLMGAKGLMQIIPRYHQEKLAKHGGDAAVLDPVSNILVGTQILREYVRRTGSLEAGLQFYNGASWDESARYTHKVLAERKRIEQAVRAGT